MRKYRRRNHGRKNIGARNILIISFIILLLLSSGYAAFNTIININVSGTAKAIGNLYVSNSGSDTEGDGTLENPYLTIQKAYNEAPKVANIYIMNDIIATTTINIKANKKIKLTSCDNNGNTSDNIINKISRDSTLTRYIIDETVGELTLENIILDGDNIDSQTAILSASNNSKIIMEKNSTITNGKNYNGQGANIRLYAGILTINNGEISNGDVGSNGGGGIWTHNNSTIDMSGGIIKNNKGCSGGGIVLQSSIFNMKNGTISNNISSSSCCGGGINIGAQSSLTMLGGTFSNNNARNGGGICINSGTFIMNSGKISNNKSSNNGGGIYITNGGVFTYNSGIICENSPSNEYETSSTCPS